MGRILTTSTRQCQLVRRRALLPRWSQVAAVALALLLQGATVSCAGSVPGKHATVHTVLDPAALENLHRLANDGNANAQTTLGILLLEGQGVEKDTVAGTALLASAAAQGHAMAQHIMGLAYVAGKGVPRDLVKAAIWFGKAAAQNNTNAMVYLANMHQGGNGIPINVKRAFALRRHAAELGDARAQVQLGYMYAEGIGVQRDDKVAIDWYRKSAMQGNSTGQVNLGYMTETGRGVRPNEEEAADWYRKAAMQGEAVAQNNLAHFYASGVAVMRDYKQAAAWFRKAAEQGHVSAQISLGYLYRNGDGVPQNDMMASEWFRMAAMKGDFSAMIMMGSLYENGRGVAANKEAAAQWRRKAVEVQMAEKKKESGPTDAHAASMSREGLFLLQQARKEAIAAGPAVVQAVNMPQKSDGRLNAELILTDDPKRLRQDWESPQENLTLITVDRVRQSQSIHGYVIFSGCTPNAEHKCTIGLSYKVFFPDGSLHSMSTTGFPLNSADYEPDPALSFGIAVAIAPEHPVGDYTIQARVRDLNTDSTLELQRAFKVSK